MLQALTSSSSLPTITHCLLGGSPSWWSEGKDRNIELLSDAIRAMRSLKYLNFYGSEFSTDVFDKVLSAIEENYE